MTGPSRARLINRLPKSVTARAGLILIVLVLFIVILGPFLTPDHPNAIDLSVRLQPPSAAHWFGTDELGRDLFARIANGGRYSLVASIVVVCFSVSLGATIGAAVAMGPRWLNAAMSQILDVAMAVPALVLTMALAAALGPGLVNVMIALIVARLPAFIMLARNQAYVIRKQAYVQAAGLYGASLPHQLRHHVIPNLAPALVVQGVADVSGIILACAALGFIGLGAQPPTPEWGALVASGKLYFLDCWWYAVFPGLAIALAATGFNLVGDAARDRLDPRTASQAAGARP